MNASRELQQLCRENPGIRAALRASFEAFARVLDEEGNFERAVVRFEGMTAELTAANATRRGALAKASAAGSGYNPGGTSLDDAERRRASLDSMKAALSRSTPPLQKVDAEIHDADGRTCSVDASLDEMRKALKTPTTRW